MHYLLLFLIYLLEALVKCCHLPPFRGLKLRERWPLLPYLLPWLLAITYLGLGLPWPALLDLLGLAIG
jgi:hypothetical protein